jgi:hypothetical protein
MIFIKSLASLAVRLAMETQDSLSRSPPGRDFIKRMLPSPQANEVQQWATLTRTSVPDLAVTKELDGRALLNFTQAGRRLCHIQYVPAASKPITL